MLFVVNIIMGLICLAAGGFLLYYNLFLCRKKVKGIYTNAMQIVVNTRYLRLFTWYRPAFSYEYNGKEYHECSFEFYTKLGLKLRFKKGKKYNIYINPDRPKCMRIRSFVFCCVLLFYVGIMCFVK